MFILGINLSHHASICLLQDGKVIFYLEDDRLTGLKEEEFTLTNPISCLKNVLSYTKYVDHVIFASYGKNFLYKENSDNSLMKHIESKMHEYGIEYGEIYFDLEHHLYHATNAFYCSGFDEAAALVLDGGGVYYNDYVRLRELESMYYFSGTEYTEIKKVYGAEDMFCGDSPIKVEDKKILSSTLSCGGIFATLRSVSKSFTPGKIMGLSSYGDAENIISKPWFSYDKDTDTWHTNNNEILKCFTKYVKGDISSEQSFINKSFADLAKKGQEESRDHTIKLIEQLLNKTNSKKIVLSGGYFLNCINNYEYLEAFPDIDFYIDPISHDGGISMGAAKYLWHCIMKNKKTYSLKTLYLS